VGGTSSIRRPDLTDRVFSKSQSGESVFEFGISTSIEFVGGSELGFEGESTLSTHGEWFESGRGDFEVSSSKICVLFHGEGGGSSSYTEDTFSTRDSIAGSTRT